VNSSEIWYYVFAAEIRIQPINLRLKMQPGSQVSEKSGKLRVLEGSALMNRSAGGLLTG